MINNMNHITLAVKDIKKSFIFYKDILGLKPLVKWNNGAYFLVGGESPEFWFCLNVDDNRAPNPCYTQYAFSVTIDDFGLMSEKILSSGIHVFKENSSPGESLYFLDPDGHKLEIHVGNWQDRINTKKTNPGSWKNIEWYV